MRKSKNQIQSKHHGTMNGYQYYSCRCVKCVKIAATRRKTYRNKNVEASRAKERELQKKYLSNPVYREKVNKRQMERYYDDLENRRFKQNQHYANNKEKIRAAIINRRKEHKINLINLLGGKCIKCGHTNPIILEFHHIDPTTKKFEISRGLSNEYSLEQLENEVKKCELLCANCHRMTTCS